MILGTNIILHTKDGKNIGNALIEGVNYSLLLKEDVYSIITDYGNRSVFTEKEIKERFHEETIIATSDHKHFIGD